MSKTHLAIVALLLALVGSNVWWAWKMLDAGVTATYQDALQHDTRRALVQSLAILPVVARADATREQVTRVASDAAANAEPFEKNGFVWVGSIGIKFGSDGKVAEVTPAWSPF